MKWNFKNLSAALGCFDKSGHIKGGLLNDHHSLTIADNKDGTFSLYDEYGDEYGDPLLTDRYDNIDHVKGNAIYTTIEFKIGGEITIKDAPVKRTLMLDTSDYFGEKIEYITVKEDFQLPGTGIILEKGDRIYISESKKVNEDCTSDMYEGEEIENLFVATTRNGKYGVQLYKDGIIYARFLPSGSGGLRFKTPQEQSLTYIISELIRSLTNPTMYEKVIIDNIGLGDYLGYAYKEIMNRFRLLRTAPKGTEEHKAWYAIIRIFASKLGKVNKSDNSIKKEIDRILDEIDSFIWDAIEQNKNNE